MSRQFLKILIVTFLAGVFLITSASLLLRLALNPSELHARIVNTIWERTGHEAGMSQASVSLLRGAIVKDFYLLDAAPSDLESITFTRAIVGLRLWDLIRGRLGVESVDLLSPHLELIINPDGTTNLADALARLRGEDEAQESTAEGESDDEETAEEEAGRSRRSSPIAVDRIRVRGGSVTINRLMPEERGDRYLDLTELALEIEDFSTAAPFRVVIHGSLGVTRQTRFDLEGEFDPVGRTFEGDLQMPTVQGPLVNSLLEFLGVENWRLDDGDLIDVSLHLRASDNFETVEVTGEMEVDDFLADVGVPRVNCEGGVTFDITRRGSDGTVVLNEVTLEIERPDENGLAVIRGEIFPALGAGDLQLNIEGMRPGNVLGAIPTPVTVVGDTAHFNVDAHVSLADDFQTGRVDGTFQAPSLRIAMLSLFKADVSLDGLAVQAAVTFNLSSREFRVENSLWSLPGVIPAENPVAVVGETSTGLGLALPALEWAALAPRVLPWAHEEPIEAEMHLAELALGRGGGPVGIPVGIDIPAIRGEGWEWRNVGGTLMLGATGLGLVDFHGEVGEGEFTLNGIVGRSWRRGSLSVERMPAEHVATLWGVEMPGLRGGLVTGEFGGSVVRGNHLTEAVVTCSVDGAEIAGHPVLNALAEATDRESLRQWSDARAQMQMALADGVWHLMNLNLRDSTARLRGAGLVVGDQCTLALTVGGSTVQVDGPLSELAFATGLTPAMREEIVASAHPTHLASLFERYEMEPPAGLVAAPEPEVPAAPERVAPIEPLEVPQGESTPITAPERPTPLEMPVIPTRQRPAEEARPTPTPPAPEPAPEPVEEPEPPRRRERSSEIDE